MVLAVIIVIMPGHVARERENNRGPTVPFRGYLFNVSCLFSNLLILSAS